MTERMGLTEFFTMEATEYLESLDGLVSPRDPPEPGQLVRLARALRGSALMAKQQGVAGTAAALENLARSIDEKRRPWDEAVRQLTIRTIDDLKIFVRAASAWTEELTTRSSALAEELDRAAGRSSAAHRQPAEPSLDAGTRAFVGREGAAVASALDQAAKSLQQNPLVHDPLQRALSLMSPLRGVASLAELPPIPDLLEGVEQAIGVITSRTEPDANAALVFHAAAKALSRAAQEVATIGRPDADAPEAATFASRLRHLLGLDAEVIPIESLFFEDGAPDIVREGTRPARPAELGRLELVAHGEHLRKAADELERSVSSIQRELRAQALAATFRALSSAGAGVLGDAVTRFAYAAGDALGRGAAVTQTDTFVSELRRAASILTATPAGAETEHAANLEGATTTLQSLRGRSGETAAVEVGDAPYTRPAAQSIATGVIQPDLTPVSAPAAAPAPPPAGTDDEQEDATIAGSWLRYERLVATHGVDNPDLEEMLAGPPAVPHAAPAVPHAAPTGVATPVQTDVPVVDIATLEYTGDRAVARAQELRAQIRERLAAGAPTQDTMNLIEEVIDLVELARSQP